eukprot:1147655-Pelagomonas_calceolata.AAC.1
MRRAAMPTAIPSTGTATSALENNAWRSSTRAMRSTRERHRAELGSTSGGKGGKQRAWHSGRPVDARWWAHTPRARMNLREGAGTKSLLFK